MSKTQKILQCLKTLGDSANQPLPESDKEVLTTEESCKKKLRFNSKVQYLEELSKKSQIPQQMRYSILKKKRQF